MQNLIENLKNLSNQILLAKKVDDYDKIISIDKSRKALIDKIFSKGIKVLSEEDIEIVLIEAALEKSAGQVSLASDKLKLRRTTLIEKMKKLVIEKPSL